MNSLNIYRKIATGLVSLYLNVYGLNVHRSFTIIWSLTLFFSIARKAWSGRAIWDRKLNNYKSMLYDLAICFVIVECRKLLLLLYISTSFYFFFQTLLKLESERNNTINKEFIITCYHLQIIRVVVYEHCGYPTLIWIPCTISSSAFSCQKECLKPSL